MREFKLSDEYSVNCVTLNSRSGFKHVATLLKNGEDIATTKCLYFNRTWERFQYESVLCKLIDKCFKGAEREQFLNVINK